MTEIEITGRRAVYSGWMTLSVVDIRLPDGRTTTREVLERADAAGVLPYDEERRTALLVRQFRAPVRLSGRQAPILEAVAGMVDDADAGATARREALEEAGVRLERLEPACGPWSSPGTLTERVWLFLAPYRAKDRVAPGGGLAEEHEEIEVLEIPLNDLASLADKGELADMKTFALVQTLRLRRPDLFETKA